MKDASKAVKRQLREWAAIAHDRELGQALSDLRAQFDRWQRGEITAADLTEQIHRFHQGASREIWKKYATNHVEPALGSAVAAGILSREELPPELVEHVAGWIEVYDAGDSGS